MSAFSSLLAALFSVSLAAPTPSTCPSIEHSVPLPPQVNQEGTSWCFAFAAATLASHKTGRALSPAAIVADYYANPRAKTMWHQLKNRNKSIADRGGYTDEALKVSREVGFCAYEDVPMASKVDLGPQKVSLGVDQFFKMLEDLEKLKQAGASLTTTCQTLQQSHPAAYKALRTNPKQFGLEDFYEVLKKEHEVNVAEWINKKCKTRISLDKGLNIVTEELSLYTLAGRVGFAPLSQRIEKVSQKLTKGPVALMVFSGSLAPPYPNGKSDHAIVAMGQRWNEKKKICELKIRDSSFEQEQWIPADMVVKTADEMISIE